VSKKVTKQRLPHPHVAFWRVIGTDKERDGCVDQGAREQERSMMLLCMIVCVHMLTMENVRGAGLLSYKISIDMFVTFGTFLNLKKRFLAMQTEHKLAFIVPSSPSRALPDRSMLPTRRLQRHLSPRAG